MGQAIRERPILFSGEMVRAILAGRKTQTRRLSGLEDVNTYPGRLKGDGSMWPLGYRGLCPSDLYIANKAAFAQNPGLFHWFLGEQPEEVNPISVRCPYGVPGDRLYVRETWRNEPVSIATGAAYNGARVVYRADCENAAELPGSPWKPSIHMPRWASRLTLEVVSVRVERLQSTSEVDAQAEGVEFDGRWWLGGVHPVKGSLQCWPDARMAFSKLWDSINGKREGCSWDANPWVWVVEFRNQEGK